jgi:prepilin-type processing-associated H-X9-DG protein
MRRHNKSHLSKPVLKLNDAYFVNNPDASSWQDIPASYHNGACGFSFADGHAEIRRWLSGTSKYQAVKFSYPATKTFDAQGRVDFQWYRERTGYVLANGSVPQYGY